MPKDLTIPLVDRVIVNSLIYLPLVMVLTMNQYLPIWFLMFYAVYHLINTVKVSLYEHYFYRGKIVTHSRAGMIKYVFFQLYISPS